MKTIGDFRPGLNDKRLLGLMKAAIERCRLNLDGAVVLTEAASGPYVVTPVLTAMAGARRVFAITRDTRHGSAEEIVGQTLSLARLAGVDDRVLTMTDKSPDIVGQADIVTNSGHVRPIDAQVLNWLKPSAVVPLMYEAWEYRTEDVDLGACRQRNIAVAGTNERHPAVGVFSFLGIMATKLLLDAGIAVCGSRVLLLSDNPFLPFIARGLTRAGATVKTGRAIAEVRTAESIDAIVIALQPRETPVLDNRAASAISEEWPGAVVTQFWGDIDRRALAAAGVPYWPVAAPAPGHMGILPSAVGPDPIVRLQTGGLKVGSLLWQARSSGLSAAAAVQAAVDMGYGQAVRA